MNKKDAMIWCCCWWWWLMLEAGGDFFFDDHGTRQRLALDGNSWHGSSLNTPAKCRRTTLMRNINNTSFSRYVYTYFFFVSFVYNYYVYLNYSILRAISNFYQNNQTESFFVNCQALSYSETSWEWSIDLINYP